MSAISKIEIVHGDITSLNIDAIVNAANSTLHGGGGVDGAIHRAAGPRLLDECKTLGGCPTGEAKITNGYNLKAKYVLHTVGPIWYGGNKSEDIFLENCYKNSLKLAVENNISSIAFPSISTGVYNFPFKRASHLALKSTISFLNQDETLNKIIFICFSERDYKEYLQIFEGYK